MTKILLRLFSLIFISLTLSNCNTTSDCTKFKTGRFYTYSPITKEKILIDRNDSMQIETNTKSGRTAKSKIRWTSPCEYKIIGMTDSKLVKDGVDSFFAVTPINVSIINTGKDFYVFNIKMDSANKHVEYSDTIRVEIN